MSTSQNPKPWPPYTTDCSQGICSVYCPQWCYLLFPPPPPPRHDQPNITYFSPIVIGVIGVLVTAFILVCYFIVISKYCRRRRGDGRITTEFNDGGEQWRDQQSAGGLDGAVLREIPVCKYKRSSDGLIQGTECSVCLAEFQEDESLRLLPKCCHAFHANCIDTWFKSHSTCPICRADVVVVITQNGVVTSDHVLQIGDHQGN